MVDNQGMDEPSSKSQKKREAEALTKLGAELVALNNTQLQALALPEILLHAINAAKQIKSFGAKKRQILLIGKLLRAADAEGIVEAYKNLIAENSGQTADFHAIEQWRERLMNTDNTALTEFIARYKPSDIQTLRQLIKKAMDEQKTGKNLGAAKALFRYLRSCVL